MSGFQEVKLRVPCFSLCQALQKLLPISSHELSSQLYHIVVQICKHRMRDGEVFRERSPDIAQLLPLLYIRSKNLLPESSLVLVLFFNRHRLSLHGRDRLLLLSQTLSIFLERSLIIHLDTTRYSSSS